MVLHTELKGQAKTATENATTTANTAKTTADDAKAAADTLGGVFEVIVQVVPAGLGSHIQWDRRLDAKIAGAMMSIQAIKGVEIGAGFQCAELPGSQIHDEVFIDANVPQVKFVDRTFNCNHEHAMAIWQYLYENDNGV